VAKNVIVFIKNNGKLNMKLDHINIAAPMDLLEKTRDFYEQVLGLEDGPRPNFPFRGYWMYGEGRPIVHLMESEEHYPNEKRPYLDHVAFQSVGVNDFVQNLKSLAMTYTARNIPDFNIAQVFCHDPCGNGVEINFMNEAIDE